MLGCYITTLFAGRVQPGAHEYNWTAGNLPSGIYILELSDENGKESIIVEIIK